MRLRYSALRRPVVAVKGSEMLIFLIWFALAIAVGVIAAGKDRNGVGWFLLAMVI
jgi:hypothetical protein